MQSIILPQERIFVGGPYIKYNFEIKKSHVVHFWWPHQKFSMAKNKCAVKPFSWAHFAHSFLSLFLSFSHDKKSSIRKFIWMNCMQSCFTYNEFFHDIAIPSLLYHCLCVWINTIILSKPASITQLCAFTLKATVSFSDEAICPC